MHLTKSFAIAAVALSTAASALAQTATPAATPLAAIPVPTPIVVQQPSPEVIAAIQALQDIRARNQEILKKQAAVLEVIDELQKEAEQIKIFSKRG